MLSEKSIVALPLIYETATNPGRWRRALDAMAESFEAKAIALLIRQPDTTHRDKQMLSSAYLDFMGTPAGVYYGLWLSKLQNPDWDFLARQPSRQLTPDTDIGLPAAALDERADYRLLRRKVGVGRRWGVKFNDDRLWFDAASIALPTGYCAQPVELAHQLSHLVPHLTKAIELGRTFGVLKAKYSAVLAALDHVRIGLAVALQNGELIVHNAELERIFDLRDGLSLSRAKRLTATETACEQQIETGIRDVCAISDGQVQPAEHLIAVPRRSGKLPFLVEVAPLIDSAAEIEKSLQGALISVIDPVCLPEVDMRRFIALYQLTEAEAAVCKLMLLGLTTDAIADQREVSPLTVKNQISAILNKTGVSRRSDFIRLVLKLVPPVG
ncbi:MAG: helix-turn-helix transcriptional regulator [Cyanobacteria bacterium J06607_6]